MIEGVDDVDDVDNDDAVESWDTDGARLLDLTVELKGCDVAHCFWSSGVSCCCCCCFTWRVAGGVVVVVVVVALNRTFDVSKDSGFCCGCCCNCCL